jgi:TPR repeat protein
VLLTLAMLGCSSADPNAKAPSSGPVCAPDSLSACAAACNAQDAPSCVTLGLAHLHGKVPGASVTEAVTLFDKACERQDPNGCAIAGNLYYEGKVSRKI